MTALQRHRAMPSTLSPAAFRRLGSAYGNRAVSRLIDTAQPPAAMQALPGAIQALSGAMPALPAVRQQPETGQHVIQRQVMSVDTWKKQAGLGLLYRLSRNPHLVPLHKALKAYHAASPKDPAKQIEALQIVRQQAYHWLRWETAKKPKHNKKRWAAVAKLKKQARQEQKILKSKGTLAVPSGVVVEARPDPTPLSKGTIPKGTRVHKQADPPAGRARMLKEIRVLVDGKKVFGTKEYMHYKRKGKGYYILSSKITMDTYSEKEGSLFPKDPSIDDVKQGGIGDCYLMAAIASVVKKNPKYVRGMMKDNGDGTVTVRLYNVVEDPPKPKTFTPRYVQVKKSIVIMKGGKAAYAGGPLWVQMLEKAYAAAGYTGKKTMQPKDAVPTFAAIKGGSANIALERLTGESGEQVAIKTGGAGTKDKFRLPWSTIEQFIYGAAKLTGFYELLTSYDIFKGDDNAKRGKVDKWMAFVNTKAINKMFKAKTGGKFKEDVRLNDFAKLFKDKALDATVANEMMAWLGAKKLYPGQRGSGKYTKEQLAVFERIKKDFDAGDFVTVSTKKYVAKKPTGVGHSGGEQKGGGLVGGHAYTVIGYKPKNPKPEDVRYVRLRNPWGKYGRRYKKDAKGNLKVVEVKEGTGEFWLELSDLTDRFYAIKKAG